MGGIFDKNRTPPEISSSRKEDLVKEAAEVPEIPEKPEKEEPVKVGLGNGGPGISIISASDKVQSEMAVNAPSNKATGTLGFQV